MLFLRKLSGLLILHALVEKQQEARFFLLRFDFSKLIENVQNDKNRVKVIHFRIASDGLGEDPSASRRGPDEDGYLET